MNGWDTPNWSIFLPFGLFIVAAVTAVAMRQRTTANWLPSLVTAAGGIAATVLGVNALLGESTTVVNGWSPTPFLQMTFRLDPLSAWFLLILGIPAVATSLYGIGYLSTGSDARLHGLDRSWVDATMAAFLAAMTLVVIAGGLLPFFFGWEAMAVISFFLVIGNGRTEANNRAAYIYGVMTQVGSMLLLGAFLLFGRNAGSWQFADWQAAASSLAGWERTGISVLAMLGLAIKAGLIPVHIWLPRAHPAAPSHGSALMSGVMVKMAIYGMVLVLFQFTTDAPAWWGALLIGTGAVSAVLGVLYSLMDRDIKRILAWSTVENIGLMVMGIGAALVLQAMQQPQASALALVGTLLHAFNHSLFKALLFGVAGAVQTATGSRDLERLGGLIRGMPKTAALALTGCAAIAAIPPLNGFVSEWMLLQSFFQMGGETASSLAGVGAAVAVGVFGLTAALALVSSVRLFGAAFLAQPRTSRAEAAKEVHWTMLAAMTILATGCVLFGIFPIVAIRLLRPVSEALVTATAAPLPGWNQSASVNSSTPAYVPTLLVVALMALGTVPWLLARLTSGTVQTRTSPTWVCGIELTPRMQYTATAVAKPLRLIFKSLLQPERRLRIERSDSAYVTTSIHYDEAVKPIYERYLYQPIVAALTITSHRVRELQNGSLRLYLSYFFVTLLILILVAR